MYIYREDHGEGAYLGKRDVVDDVSEQGESRRPLESEQKGEREGEGGKGGRIRNKSEHEQTK